MRKLLMVALLGAGLTLAGRPGVEVGGEVAPDGLRPYVLLSWSERLGPGLYLVPSLLLYPQDLEATLRRGFLSLQLLREGEAFTAGLEVYLRGPFPALRLFLRAGW